MVSLGISRHMTFLRCRYTMLRHDDIKAALKFVIKLAFRNNKSKFIAVYKSGFRWVNTHRNSTFVFNVEDLITSVDFLLDNSYFTIGNDVFKQIIGVPIGVDAGPYIANLTLWYFENKFLESTYKSKYLIAKKLCKTFRLIDDITSVNSDGCFETYFNLIYPESLELNRENSDDSSACVLDLDISIVDGKFKCGIYDKRDDFNFNIVQFQPLCCNQASSILYGIFTSQIIRYYRICNQLTYFTERANRLFNDLIILGYSKEKLCGIYRRTCDKYGFSAKFGPCNDILVYTSNY